MLSSLPVKHAVRLAEAHTCDFDNVLEEPLYDMMQQGIKLCRDGHHAPAHAATEVSAAQSSASSLASGSCMHLYVMAAPAHGLRIICTVMHQSHMRGLNTIIAGCQQRFCKPSAFINPATSPPHPEWVCEGNVPRCLLCWTLSMVCSSTPCYEHVV